MIDATVRLTLQPGVTPIMVPFAELPSLVGREFVGPWFTVDDDRRGLFDHATYVDENVKGIASEAYPDGLVEGFHLLGLLDHLLNAVMSLSGPQAFGWNYGCDRVRFVSPVRAGEPIRIVGRVERVVEKGAGFLVRTDCQLEVQGRERPGFIAEWWVYWIPPHATSAHN